MKALIRRLQKIEDFIIVSTFLVMVFASFLQVVNRNLVQASISWFEELSRYTMIYMALLATELGLRDNTQMAITALPDRLSPPAGHALGLVTRAFVIAFAAILFVTSFQLLKAQFTFGQSSPGLGLPMYVPYFALPLSFGIITLKQTAMLIHSFLHPEEAEHPPQADESEKWRREL